MSEVLKSKGIICFFVFIRLYVKTVNKKMNISF